MIKNPVWVQKNVVLALHDALLSEHGGQLAQPVRIALTGKKESPGIYEVVLLLGKDTTISRLNNAIDWIDSL